MCAVMFPPPPLTCATLDRPQHGNLERNVDGIGLAVQKPPPVQLTIISLVRGAEPAVATLLSTLAGQPV